MPKVKSLIPDPPVDLLLAVILERKQAKNFSLADLSTLTGFTPVYLSNLLHTSPWDWPPKTLRLICRTLNVPQKYLSETVSLEERR